SGLVAEAGPPAPRCPGVARHLNTPQRCRRRFCCRRMKIPPVNVPRLVVRSDPPGRRRLVIGLLLLAVTVLLWGAFQWGRGNLGLPGGVTPDRVTLRDRVNLLEG